MIITPNLHTKDPEYIRINKHRTLDLTSVSVLSISIILYDIFFGVQSFEGRGQRCRRRHHQQGSTSYRGATGSMATPISVSPVNCCRSATSCARSFGPFHPAFAGGEGPSRGHLHVVRQRRRLLRLPSRNYRMRIPATSVTTHCCRSLAS